MDKELVVIMLQESSEDIENSKRILRMIQNFHLLGVPFVTCMKQVAALLEDAYKRK